MSENNGPITLTDAGKSLPELVSMGCQFVVPGGLFEAVIGLINKLSTDGNPDAQGLSFLTELRETLILHSVPVKPRAAPSKKLII